LAKGKTQKRNLMAKNNYKRRLYLFLRRRISYGASFFILCRRKNNGPQQQQQFSISFGVDYFAFYFLLLPAPIFQRRSFILILALYFWRSAKMERRGIYFRPNKNGNKKIDGRKY